MSYRSFRSMKYGLFVHYVAGLSVRADGQRPATGDETARAFDAEGFARDLERFGVEYIIFTAWHFNAHCLYPSAASDRWAAGHSVERDLIGDMIREVAAKGIGVLLYTHPRDGHDFSEADAIATGWGAGGKPFAPNPNPATFDFKRWNDYINDVYAEVVDRYGKDILGLYLDEGSARGDSGRVVDYGRLRNTIKGKNPHLVMVQNYYGNLYSCDMGDKEYCHWGEFASADGGNWPSYTMPVGTVVAKNWMADTKRGINVVRFKAEDLYRYTVLQAGTCIDGGGVQWAAGPYAGGGWEDGVDEILTKLGALIEPVAESIKGTFPSNSWYTWSFLHVLKPQKTNTLALPRPVAGTRFDQAVLLPSRLELPLVQDKDGLRVTLPPGAAWDAMDTVIELRVAN